MTMMVLDFWSRFDKARTGTLSDVSLSTGIPVGTIKNLRSRKLLPSLADTIAIADYLHVTLDWLVLGKVIDEKGSELSEVLKSYSEADVLTQLMVRRLLKLT